MPSKKAERKKVNRSTFEKSLTMLGSRLKSSAPKKHGCIQLFLTDLGEEFYLEGTDRAFLVSQRAGASPPLVRIAGPASQLQAVMDGKKEASRTFLAGGIQVSGDLNYLEVLLKDMGLLKCE